MNISDIKVTKKRAKGSNVPNIFIEYQEKKVKMPGAAMADEKATILEIYKRDAEEVFAINFDYKKWRTLSDHGLQNEDEETYESLFDYCVELHNTFVELFGEEGVKDFYYNLVNDENEETNESKHGESETNKDLKKILEKTLKSCFKKFAENSEDMDNYFRAISCIRECRFSVPYDTEGQMPKLDIENLKVGDTFTLDNDVIGKPTFLNHISGNRVLPIFTENCLMDAMDDDLIKFDMIMNLHFSDILERAKNYNIHAIIINPFTDNIPVLKSMIDRIENINPIFGNIKEGFKINLGNRKRRKKKDARKKNITKKGMQLQAFNMEVEGADAFTGEAINGFGSMWSAVFGENEDIINHLSAMLEAGKNTVSLGNDDVRVAFIEYPEESSFKAGILCVKNPETGRFEAGPGYPLMQGQPNKLIICGQKAWKNELEGDIFARKDKKDGPSISFFNPYFFYDAKQYVKGRITTVNLAALALSCEESKDKEVVLSKGNSLYDQELEKFLAENPDKTEADFEAPVIQLAGMRILISRNYLSLYEFRCPVLEVRKLKFCGKTIWKMTVPFVGWNEQEIIGNLYVPDEILNGFKPKKGDDIQGVLWMTGYSPVE